MELNNLNFDWVIDDKLAGHAELKSMADLHWLEQQGIKVLIRMGEKSNAVLSTDDVTDSGLLDHQVPVKDFTAPTPEQSIQMVGLIDKYMKEGRSVGVSCGAGLGRTGTILACYLVNTGLSAKGAIKLVRQKRPGSIETKEQEEAVTKFMDDLEIQRKWPKTVDEAVDRILLMISEEDKNTINNCQSENDMAVYHGGLGMWVRNNFGLWRDNKELIQSCGGHKHPDNNSAVILLSLWHKLHEQYPSPKA